MLYTSFRVTAMGAAILGIIHMIAESSFVYIYFPIVIIIWTIYSFFDENDSEYLRRNGIDPDEVSWFFPDYSDYGIDNGATHTNNVNRKSYPARSNNTSTNSNVQYARYAPPQGYINNWKYNGFKKKCKRNFKITITQNKDEE